MPPDSSKPQKTKDNKQELLRQQYLQDKLHQQEGLHRLSKTDEYQLHLKPLLQRAVVNKWLDPADFKTLEHFHKAYSESFGRAKAYQEIMDMIDNAHHRIDDIKKQQAIKTASTYEI